MRGYVYLAGICIMLAGIIGSLVAAIVQVEFMSWVWMTAAGYGVVLLAVWTDRADPETSARLDAVDRELKAKGL